MSATIHRQPFELPHITRDALPTGLSAAEIDAAVRERTERGEAIYELDEGSLSALEPDLIVTQALCPVCAVSYEDVVKLAAKLPSKPKVISLDPRPSARLWAMYAPWRRRRTVASAGSIWSARSRLASIA